MIANLRLILWGVATVAILGAGLYGRHVWKEAQRVPALVETINTLNAQRVQEREANQKALLLEADLRARLGAADARAADFARRLRRAFASLPEPAAGAAEPAGTGRDAGGVDGARLDSAINRVRAVCEKAGIKSEGWRTWYAEVPDELK